MTAPMVGLPATSPLVPPSIGTQVLVGGLPFCHSMLQTKSCALPRPNRPTCTKTRFKNKKKEPWVTTTFASKYFISMKGWWQLSHGLREKEDEEED